MGLLYKTQRSCKAKISCARQVFVISPERSILCTFAILVELLYWLNYCLAELGSWLGGAGLCIGANLSVVVLVWFGRALQTYISYFW